MKISELPKNIVYAIVFGFMGLIVGIWIADVLYMLTLKNLERMTTTYISLVIIISIIVSASVLGFVKGRKLLE